MTALKIILLVFAFLLLIYAIFSLILKFKKKHDIKKKQQNDSSNTLPVETVVNSSTGSEHVNVVDESIDNKADVE